MELEAGFHETLWTLTSRVKACPPLTTDEQADVCVVGSGIAGLTAAYLIARDGHSVVVLDDGAIAGGETSRTTAHLVDVLDDGYVELERLHGERGARLAAGSHRAAIERIGEIAAAEGIDCDLRAADGYLVAHDAAAQDGLWEEMRAARRAGLRVEHVEHVPLEWHDFGPALHFAGQAQFHPLKYVNGLVEALGRRGARLYQGAHVTDVEAGPSPVVSVSGGRRVSAGAVVVATNTPINNRFALHTKQAAYRTYVIAAHIPRDALPAMLLWDTADPYHYVRTHPGNGEANGGDWLIVGGEDHKTGQPQSDRAEEPFQALEAWTRARFPMAREFTLRWSGQVMEPVDALAFIGRNPGDENVYVATGDSGNGMTHGTIAGMLLSDLIGNRGNPWESLYDPSRKSLRAAPRFARENLDVAGQYADYLTPGQEKTVEDIAPGEGALVRRGLSKIAAYRGPDGALHRHSAVCPHLGCLVGWNAVEKTWDCPCHGSRFDKVDGHAINGPAVAGLSPAD